VFVSVNWKDLATTSADGTERTDTGHGASYDVAQAAAGATGNKTTSGGDGWAVLVLALKPSGATSTSDVPVSVHRRATRALVVR
jgi:hypothetical protein